MHFGQFSYAVTVLIFAGTAVIIEYACASRLLRNYLRLILVAIAIGLVATAGAERYALAWRAWTYNPMRTSQIFVFGAALETYLFITLVTIAVAAATIVWAHYEEQSKPLIMSTWRDLVRKLLRVMGAVQKRRFRLHRKSGSRNSALE